jgi:hypothetical protein
VAAVVQAELDRRRAAEAEAEAVAEYDIARCPTGACACCGLEASIVLDPQTGRRSPGWHTNPDGPGHVCEPCWRDLHEGAWFSTRDDRRVGAIRMLLGGPPIPLRAMSSPGEFAGVKVWHHEFPGAPPVGAEDRWRHVDRVRLAEQWQAIATPHVDPSPGLKPRTTPCPRCGVCRWRADWRSDTYQGADTNWEPVTTGMRFTEACAVCGAEPDERPASAGDPFVRSTGGRMSNSEEADRTTAELLGVHEVAYGEPVIPGLAKRAGFRWFYETGGDRQGRRRPSAEPWAHLDIARMRRRAALDHEPVA